MKKQKEKHILTNQQGFTLAELLVVFPQFHSQLCASHSTACYAGGVFVNG